MFASSGQYPNVTRVEHLPEFLPEEILKMEHNLLQPHSFSTIYTAVHVNNSSDLDSHNFFFKPIL